MTVRLNPYLAFRDTAREAMEAYRSVFGGELEVSTFAEGGMSDMGGDSVMHAMLTTDDGFVLMGADTPAGMDHTPGSGSPVSLSGDDEAKLRGWWDALSQDGTVTMPLEKAPWGDSFGACTDRFGVAWMVNIGAAPA